MGGTISGAGMNTERVGGSNGVIRRAKPPRVLLATDAVAALIAWTITFLVIGPIVLPDRSTAAEVALMGGFTVMGLLVAWYNNLYRGNLGRERTYTMLRTIRSLVFVTLLAALGGVAFNLAAKELAVGIVLLWFLTLFFRAVVSARVRVRRAFGENHDRLLIVGAGQEARQLVDVLHQNPELGLDPVAVVGNAAEASMVGLGSLFQGPVLRAPERIEEFDINHAVVITNSIPAREVQDTIGMLKQTGAELMLAAELGAMQQRTLQARPISFAPMFRVDEGAPLERKLRFKRAVDLTLAVIGLVITAPFQLLAAIAIKVTDGGPVLYRQTRLGLNGESFEVLRFRIMSLDAGSQYAHHDALWTDDRMTWIGRLLEITGLNEIPQLWNIVRDEMSIVGPRPGYPALDGAAPLAMKPGLTGIWRIEANLDPTSKIRRQIDDMYVENWSVLLDTGIMLSSIELILVRFFRGASWRHAVSEATASQTIPAYRVEPALS